MITRSRIICGDAYKKIQKLSSQSVDLCYLDPPFFSKRLFEVETKDGKLNSFDDTWDNDIEKYLNYMNKVLIECHRVLKKTGSLYLHCDWHVSHYLKVELDRIFGYDKFRNEIIWRRHNAHNDTKQGCKLFGRVHDIIFFYSKSKKYIWNPIYEPYPEEYIQKNYKRVEGKSGRRYALGDLSGPGGHSKGNPKYEFLGVTRYWRYSNVKMKKLYKEGRIIQTKEGNVPVLKRYLDEMPGLTLQDVWCDVWSDIKSVQVTKNESVDYPTQKPIRLLERIIEVSTNEKDIVLDCMCGSGTTLIAAKNLNRKYIGIDKSYEACNISRNRIRQRQVRKSRDKKIKLLREIINY